MKILQSIVEHPYFSRAIIALICINGVTMWLETVPEIMLNYAGILHSFDTLVVGIFAIEAVLKLIVYRLSYFKNGWNVFDFSIVVISLIPSGGWLQILRIFRVFRLFRLISIIPQMRRVVTALFAVIPGMLSVWALLTVIFYIFAIITTQTYGAAFPQWFWTLGQSFYTLFQIMTLESWSMGIVRPVMEQFPLAWIVFVSFIFIATFIMVNLIIAIVVEAMWKLSQEEENHIIDKIDDSQHASQADIKRLEDKIDALIQAMKS